MSYILEAIKKADRKRKLGEIPDVHTDHNGLDLEEPAKRASWPYLLALLLFFNAVGIFWWLEPWEKEPAPKGVEMGSSVQEFESVVQAHLPGVADIKKEEEEAENPAVQPDGEALNKPRKADLRAAVVTEEGVVESQADLPLDQGNQEHPDPEEEKGETAALAPLAPPALAELEKKAPQDVQEALTEEKDTQGEAQTELSSDDGKAIEQEGKGGAKEEVLEPGVAGAEDSQAVSQEGMVAPEVIMAEGTAELKNPLSNISETDELDGTEVSDNATEESDNATVEEIKIEIFDITKVPFVYQLPSSIQEKIPEISISFHSYTYRPETRMVRLNGRIMREGQDLTKEIKLEKIVPTGVVLVIEKRRFRVDV